MLPAILACSRRKASWRRASGTVRIKSGRVPADAEKKKAMRVQRSRRDYVPGTTVREDRNVMEKWAAAFTPPITDYQLR